MKNLIVLQITVFMFMAPILPVHAAMYKYIDSDGNVSYSQTPPADQPYKTIKSKVYKPVTKKARAKTKSAKESIQSGTDSKTGDKIVDDELAKNKKLRAENCKKAKQNLELFTVYKRLKGKDGEYYRVKDDERTNQIKLAKKNIKEFC